MSPREKDALWNGERGAGGISWSERSRMGLLRGVIDAADTSGRRNAYMHALHVEVLRRVLRGAGPLRNALDFGCGTGRFIEVLSEYASRVCATDKEPSMVEAAREYAGHRAAQIVRCDPAKLPFDASSFDFTLCSSVLCVTMRELIHEIIGELARVTRPGGRLLLLEQVSDDRGLSVKRYHDALSLAGFRVTKSYPIRSGSSLFTRFASRSGWVPVFAFPTLAAAELLMTARGLTPGGSKYTEYAIEARR